MDEKTRDDLLKLFESKLNEAMRFYLETCTRCGVCTEACHVYASMGQVRYIAAYRSEIIRRLYKKYFKARGKFWPSVGEAKELSEMALPMLRRRHIAFIFQSFNLLSALNGVENVEVMLDLQGIKGRRARKTAMELLEHVGLADR